MADVITPPRIRCDNCGFVQEKQPVQSLHGKICEWHKPRQWGRLELTGGLSDAYGIEARTIYPDLCKDCAKAAQEAVATALSARRGEGAG